MNSQKYWEKRSELILTTAEKEAALVEAEIVKAYNKAFSAVKDEILTFYVTHYKGKEPIKHVDVMKANRLNELQRKINKHLKKLGDAEEKKLVTLMEKVLTESQLMTIFNVQQFTGVGSSFLLMQPERVKEILEYPWSGASFSKRIWKDKDKLASTLEETLTQGFVRGLGANEMAETVAERMEVSKRHAMTLVRTETAYVAGQGTAEGYQSAGIEMYEVLATLDTRTSDVCQQQDGKRYPISEMRVGANYPPFHPRCRTTTVPVIDDKVTKRIARNAEGRNIHVPSTMTYAQWKKEYAS